MFKIHFVVKQQYKIINFQNNKHGYTAYKGTVVNQLTYVF